MATEGSTTTTEPDEDAAEDALEYGREFMRRTDHDAPPTFQEIGDALGVSAPTALRWYRSAMRKVRRGLGVRVSDGGPLR